MKSRGRTRLGSRLPQAANGYWIELQGKLPASGKILGILGNLLDCERILGPAYDSYPASPERLLLKTLQGFVVRHHFGFAQKSGGARSGQGQLFS